MEIGSSIENFPTYTPAMGQKQNEAYTIERRLLFFSLYFADHHDMGSLLFCPS